MLRSRELLGVAVRVEAEAKVAVEVAAVDEVKCVNRRPPLWLCRKV